MALNVAIVSTLKAYKTGPLPARAGSAIRTIGSALKPTSSISRSSKDRLEGVSLQFCSSKWLPDCKLEPGVMARWLWMPSLTGLEPGVCRGSETVGFCVGGLMDSRRLGCRMAGCRSHVVADAFFVFSDMDGAWDRQGVRTSRVLCGRVILCGRVTDSRRLGC
jgi:hypothetical protein